MRLCFATCRYTFVPPSPNSIGLGAKTQKRADVVGAEALYKKAGAIDPCHANSIYNYAVLLDSSLKQQEVRLFDTRRRSSIHPVLRDSHNISRVKGIKSSLDLLFPRRCDGRNLVQNRLGLDAERNGGTTTVHAKLKQTHSLRGPMFNVVAGTNQPGQHHFSACSPPRVIITVWMPHRTHVAPMPHACHD